MGVSLPSGSRTRRPARSAAPDAPLGVRRGGLGHLPGGGPAPASAHHPAWPAGLLPLGSRSISSSSSPSSISSGLACWASSASSSREASLLGKVGGRGRGATRLSWARQPPSLPAPPLLKSWLAPSPAPPTRPHLTNRILLWAREGWSCSASAASCSARCSSSFMSSMPLCPGARSDTAGEAWGSDAVGRLSSTTALGACIGLGAAGRPPTWA